MHFLSFFCSYFCFKFIHMYTYTYIYFGLGGGGQWGSISLILREEHKLNNFVLRFLEPISYAWLWDTRVFCARAKVLPAF